MLINPTITIILLMIASFSSIICDFRSPTAQDDHTDHIDSDKPSTRPEHHPQNLADPEYIKRELKDLVHRNVDADKDGSVSFEELKNYLGDLHDKNIEYNINKQWVVYSPQIHEVFSWEGYEPEKREVLTWDHYFNQTYPELIGVDIGVPIHREQDTASILGPAVEEAEKKKKEGKEKKVENDKDEDPHIKMLKLMVHRADARWKLADENGDTLLTKPEFKHLLHPDEGHEELQNLFVREATEDMDVNKDGKICLDEFMKHIQVLASEQERNDKNWLSSQQENFGRFLDKNKDGILDGPEIKDWLIPAKSKKFEAEAKRLMDICDTNEDHKLSNVELIEHYEQLLTLLPAEYWRNSDDPDEVSEASLMGDQGSHDEL